MGRPKIIDRYEDLNNDKKISVLLELLECFDENKNINEEEKKKIYDEYIDIIENIKYVNDLFDLKNNICIFNSLPEKRKWNVLRALLRELEEQNKKYTQDKRVTKCNELGHMYNEWEKSCKTVTSDAYFDREVIHNYTEKYDYWYRKCARCGHVEEVYQKPQELIDEEKRKQKDSEIKSLEKRLKQLKGE